jgi:monoamine oxidase
MFFAGEHTSVDFNGYMEGAAETGERVAKEVLARIGRRV